MMRTGYPSDTGHFCILTSGGLLVNRNRVAVGRDYPIDGSALGGVERGLGKQSFTRGAVRL